MAEMTVNEFVNSFIDAGFDFTYRATKGEVIIHRYINIHFELLFLKHGGL